MQTVLNELVKNVKENIPGYIGVSVTEMSSGESLVSDSALASFDPAIASAFNVEIINAKLATMKKLGISSSLEDIKFNLSDQIHTINISPKGDYFVYLALDRAKSNVAVTRNLMKRYTETLNNEL